MGLFSKPVELHADLAGRVVPSYSGGAKAVAEIQDAARAALQPSESILCVGVDGGKVLVVTTNRVLIFHKGQMQAIDVTEVSGVAVGPWRGFPATVTATPGISMPLRDAGEALRFAASLEPRNVPRLEPDFFNSILDAVGLPRSDSNVERLAEMVARQIAAGGAAAYFRQTQDADADQRFNARFMNHRPEQITKVADEMIDFLWAWNFNCHDSVRELVQRIRQILTDPESQLRTYQNEIPPSQW